MFKVQLINIHRLDFPPQVFILKTKSLYVSQDFDIVTSLVTIAGLSGISWESSHFISSKQRRSVSLTNEKDALSGFTKSTQSHCLIYDCASRLFTSHLQQSWGLETQYVVAVLWEFRHEGFGQGFKKKRKKNNNVRLSIIYFLLSASRNLVGELPVNLCHSNTPRHSFFFFFNTLSSPLSCDILKLERHEKNPNVMRGDATWRNRLVIYKQFDETTPSRAIFQQQGEKKKKAINMSQMKLQQLLRSQISTTVFITRVGKCYINLFFSGLDFL